MTRDQPEIREAALRICAGFDDTYWFDRGKNVGFPEELQGALAKGGRSAQTILIAKRKGFS